MTLVLVCSAKAELYPTVFLVNAIDEDADTMELVDFNGFIWEYHGVEDFEVDDFAAAIMDDADTEFIFDDTIVTLRYCGYIPNPFEGEWGDSTVRVWNRI